MVCLSTSPMNGTNAPYGVNEAFDAERVIASLLADKSCASCELPCWLSADQRKHVKKLAEKYSNLKCESFGMGKERRVCLFKEEAPDGEHSPDCSPHRVKVKNTFIDDFIDSESTVDERVVQSMPHNMFGQRLSEELAAQGQLISHTTSVQGMPLRDNTSSRGIPSTLIEDQPFCVGAAVVIEGLVKAPHFNGAQGVVQSFDAETGRYNVLLASAAPDGQRWAKIKAENLRQE